MSGAYKINWPATERKLFEALQEQNNLIHYRTAYDLYTVFDQKETFSEKTDAAEKVRQYFAENCRPEIMAIDGGFLALRRWAPSRQSQLFSHPPSCIVPGCVYTGFDSGYDLGRRVPYMKDHFGDAQTDSRYRRRRKGALTEFHVNEHFRVLYEEFWRPASNAGDYRRASLDDFRLEVPYAPGKKIILPIDVKSLTDSDKDDDEDDRERSGVIRKIHDGIIYLFADWDEEKKQAVMYGLDSGAYLQDIGVKVNDLTLINSRNLLPIDVLLVLLNIAKRWPFGDKFRAIQRAAANSRPLGLNPNRCQAA
jgi:hypothetical protein